MATAWFSFTAARSLLFFKVQPSDSRLQVSDLDSLPEQYGIAELEDTGVMTADYAGLVCAFY